MVEVTPARHLCYIVFIKLSIPIIEHSSIGGNEAHMWKSLEGGGVEIVASSSYDEFRITARDIQGKNCNS